MFELTTASVVTGISPTETMLAVNTFVVAVVVPAADDDVVVNTDTITIMHKTSIQYTSTSLYNKYCTTFPPKAVLKNPSKPLEKR